MLLHACFPCLCLMFLVSMAGMLCCVTCLNPRPFLINLLSRSPHSVTAHHVCTHYISAHLVPEWQPPQAPSCHIGHWQAHPFFLVFPSSLNETDLRIQGSALLFARPHNHPLSRLDWE
jgi:hypothetical protein